MWSRASKQAAKWKRTRKVCHLLTCQNRHKVQSQAMMTCVCNFLTVPNYKDDFTVLVADEILHQPYTWLWSPYQGGV